MTVSSHFQPLPGSGVASDNRAHPPCRTATSALVDQVDVDLDRCTPLIKRREIRLETEGAFDVVDVTDHCATFVADSRAEQGTLTVFSPHTTCAIKINEWEAGFLQDLRVFIDSLVPAEADYRHDDFEVRDPATLAGDRDTEPFNGHSHIQQMLLGSASESVPIIDGALGLGSWQRIMFIELDRSRPRQLQLQVQGWGSRAVRR